MKAIRVNADYEIELFTGRSGPKVMNEALEFLAFYLEEKPVFTSKKYSSAFFQHVHELTGLLPKTTSVGDFENWWGKLSDIPLERKLNSKELSSRFSHAQIIQAVSQLQLEENCEYLAKDPHGMSGQNFLRFTKSDLSGVEQLLKRTGHLAVEPFFKRLRDFSCYVFPDDHRIYYENLVDERFQYKGTLFRDISDPSSSQFNLPTDFAIDQVVEFYRQQGAADGFSIDCFSHENGIHISEVNYRRTMGLVAFELSKTLSRGNPWCLFLLGKGSSKKLLKEQGIYLLSPGDTRFEMVLITAQNEKEGIDKVSLLKELLPDTEFSVKI